MCGFADFRKDFSGFFRIFVKVYEDFRSDTPLDLPGFNRSFLPVEIGDFLQKAPFESLPKMREKNSKQTFPLLSFLA